MTVVPWFDVPTDLNASHRVRAPGGYERWSFDMADAASDVRVVAVLEVGSATDSEYLKAYERFAKKPTKWPPPTPADLAIAHCAIYRDGRHFGRFRTRAAKGSFSVSTEQLDVSIGGNRLTRTADGIRLTISGDSEEGGRLDADLLLRPTPNAEPREIPIFTNAMSEWEHRWVLAEFGGEAAGSASVAGERLNLRGGGFHDHDFGEGPVGRNVRRWVKGHASFASRTMAFHVAYPWDEAAAVEVRFFEADASGVREHPVTFKSGYPSPCPRQMDFGTHLHLSNPRELDGRCGLVVCDASAGGETGTALCEVVRPD